MGSTGDACAIEFFMYIFFSAFQRVACRRRPMGCILLSGLRQNFLVLLYQLRSKFHPYSKVARSRPSKRRSAKEALIMKITTLPELLHAALAPPGARADEHHW